MFSVTVLGAPLYDIVWFFFILCFIGAVAEMVFCLTVHEGDVS